MTANFDILSDVLDSLHICGSLLLHESYAAPWAISVPQADQLGQLLNVKPGTRAVVFHLVERGYLDLTSVAIAGSDQQPLVVEAGEMVICFSSTPHQISQGINPPSISVEQVLAGADIPFRRPAGARGISLVCLCGVFYLHDTHLNPLFAALPPILHIPVSGNLGHRSGVANLIVQELEQPSPGSNFMIEHLLELLCAGAVRSYMTSLQPQEPSWLTGLRDPIISRALALIHAQPGGDWSVYHLAQSVALSPSRFAARFKETLGESPMSYVSKWRIHVASRLLNSTEKTISEIASEVGYENLAAFTRAFKRHLDIPPGVWRSQSAGGTYR